jgi:hypothetical protein
MFPLDKNNLPIYIHHTNLRVVPAKLIGKLSQKEVKVIGFFDTTFQTSYPYSRVLSLTFQGDVEGYHL